ncbi:uncharacterized protein LOC127263597 [Andrographis paniculata]|uniref:uncharacterized protein LOC127263597 n=1 Tax=Andrographis paniculata TaxID=175694 RepID=UPI0021E7F560|nr:uncharacterized protein LOC127263597 [Andrographis paniculata]
MNPAAAETAEPPVVVADNQQVGAANPPPARARAGRQPNGIPDPAAEPLRLNNPPAPVYADEMHRRLPCWMVFFEGPNAWFYRSFLVGILFFLLISSFALIGWMLLHPVFPQFHVADAALAAVKFSGTRATGTCRVTVFVDNTSPHLTTIFESIEISLIYPSTRTILSETYAFPFAQAGPNRTTIRANLSFSGVDLGADGVRSMKQDIDRGSLTLGVWIRAEVKFRNWKWRVGSIAMDGYCSGLSFQFTSGDDHGMFLNPYLLCYTYISR